MIDERAIEFFEVTQATMEAAADDRCRYMMAAARNSRLHAGYCESNRPQPQEDQLDVVTCFLPLRNLAGIRPPAKGCLKTKFSRRSAQRWISAIINSPARIAAESGSNGEIP